MQMKNTPTLFALSRTACVIVLTSLGVSVSAQTAQFEYDLRLLLILPSVQPI